MMSRHALLHSRLVLLVASLSVALALLGPQVSAAGRQSGAPDRPRYAPGEVLIGWEPGRGPVPEVQRVPGRFELDRSTAVWRGAAAAISQATGLDVLDAAPEHGIARLKVSGGKEAAEIARLQRLPWVQYAEPNYYAHAAEAAYPNDPDFPLQWNMHRIKAADAWSMTQGSGTFVVAVLDTGIAAAHPEFDGQLAPSNLWRNYITGQVGADDDNWESHGTHVAGIIAAKANNLRGISGLAPQIKILPQKVLDDQGNGPYYALINGILGAANRSAQVINLSLSGPASAGLLKAVQDVQSRGVLVVAAAGNCADRPNECWEGSPINPDVFPAGYPDVLAVAASDRVDRITPYSGYKPYVSIAAPGGTYEEPVWSTTRAGYGWLYGTSMSTPLVSAAAALVWTLRPAATPTQIADILKSTADKVGTYLNSDEPLSYASGRNDYFGAGRLNVANAVRWAYPPMLASGTGPDINLLLGGSTGVVTRTVPILNASDQGVLWSASVFSGAPWLSLNTANGASLYSTPGTLTLRADRGTLAAGTYVGVIHVQPVYPDGVEALDLRVVLRVSDRLSMAYLPLVAQNLQPDWLDPDAPTALSRNVVPLANDVVATLVLPFAVSFYGNSYQTVQVSDNGLILFGSAYGMPTKAATICPGDGRQPNNAVYVLAYNWDPTLGGQIVVHQPDAQTFVVTWQGVRRPANPLAQSFQVVIKSDGTIRGNYRSVETPLPGIIGAENYDGAFSQEVLCNGAGRQVKSGESVDFDTRLPW